MFADHASHNNFHAVPDDSATQTPVRRQYTLKGVEAEAVALMRQAANQDGMKISAWVSLKMREAAERSLKRSIAFPTDHSDTNASQAALESTAPCSLGDVNTRMHRLESELREVVSAQRVIMTNLLKRD